MHLIYTRVLEMFYDGHFQIMIFFRWNWGSRGREIQRRALDTTKEYFFVDSISLSL